MALKKPLLGYGEASLKDIRQIKGDLVFVLTILESPPAERERKKCHRQWQS